MNKFIQKLLLIEKFEIKTKLPKAEILKRVESFADLEYTDYYGVVWENGFWIAEKSRKHFPGGHTKNPFVPIARGKITEEDGFSTVSVTIRMYAAVMALLVPICFFCLALVLPFLLLCVLLHFAFVKPSKRLKEAIESLVLER